jgi:serine/threonine protein kinase
MSAPFCPSCDEITLTGKLECPACGGDRPIEGWPVDDLVDTVFEETYTVVRRLGSGGFGVVYLAENREFGAKRAIKVLHSQYVHNDQVLRRFKREAKALYRLQSPYTVRLERWGRTESGHYYLIMELAEGETLAQIVHKQGPLEERRALSIVRQTAVALADAHALSIIHRDLKPANIIVRSHPHEGERVVVLDFGISKILSDQTSSRRSGLVGTPLYMAPECWKPEMGPPDHRADLWSLGVVFYEMLTGGLPYKEGTTSDPVSVAMQACTLDPRAVVAGLAPHSLHTKTIQMAVRLLATRPENRFDSPDALLAAIDSHPMWAAGGRPTIGAARRPGGRGDPMSEEVETIPVNQPETVAPFTDSLDAMTFHDEPPEGFTMGRRQSEPVEEPSDTEKRPPQLRTVLIALLLLGAIAALANWGQQLFGPRSNGRTDAGVTQNDAGDDGRLAPPTTLEGSDGVTLQLVDGGITEIGDDAIGIASPRHEVLLDSFYLDAQGVTVALWQACVEAGRCLEEQTEVSGNSEECHLGTADTGLALNCVSWHGADTYCHYVGRRLPTEAEWEHAASSSVQEGGHERAWVSDWYSHDYYQASPTINPTGPIFGTDRVIRGGSRGGEARSVSERDSKNPSERTADLGFRCARSVL